MYNTPSPKNPKFEVCDASELGEVLRLSALLGNEREISDTLALRVDELKRELGDLPEAQRDLMARNKKLHHANQNLVAALDRIHDVLNGVYVDDVAGIVNRALAVSKGAKT